MEIRFSLGRDVHDYRLTRTLDLHSARYPNGRYKKNLTYKVKQSDPFFI